MTSPRTPPRFASIAAALAAAGVLLGLLGACGGDAVTQTERVIAPGAISTPSGLDVHGDETTLAVVNGGAGTGLVVTDHRGFAVYGVQGETRDSLVCLDDCTNVWVPLAPRGGTVSEQLDEDKFDRFSRPDGTEQVAYDGIPLYLWTGDNEIGVPAGAGVAGIWFALRPTEAE